MVGFPGETDFEFEETRHMIEDLSFTYLHVFTFSARPGTPAATLPNQVPVHIARERNRILRELGAEKKRAFMGSFIGRQVDAITLADGANPYAGSAANRQLKSLADSGRGRASALPNPGHQNLVGWARSRALPAWPTCTPALTDNYLKLQLCGKHEPNRWLRVLVESVQGEILYGAVPNC
jgi:hypothetical protein